MAFAVSEHVERYIRERLPSAEQIDIVLLLRRDAARAWSVPEVSEALGTPPESTAMRLFLLASNGVVTFEQAGLPRYRYAASEPLEELAAAAEQNRDAVYAIVGGPAPRDPLRSFADAFKLKK